jgi:hypothetical protein
VALSEVDPLRLTCSYVCFHSTIEVDEFTGGLFKIYETVHNEGIAQVRNC